jgi:hypothetical protein
MRTPVVRSNSVVLRIDQFGVLRCSVSHRSSGLGKPLGGYGSRTAITTADGFSNAAIRTGLPSARVMHPSQLLGWPFPVSRRPIGVNCVAVDADSAASRTVSRRATNPSGNLISAARTCVFSRLIFGNFARSCASTASGLSSKVIVACSGC